MGADAPEQPDLPEWALFVREPFARRIVDGRKVWEMRRSPTNRRGRIGILSERGLIGTADLYDVAGPFEGTTLAQHVDKHRAALSVLVRYAEGRPLYAWVLRGAVALAEPIAIARGRGPMVWRRLRGSDGPDP